MTPRLIHYGSDYLYNVFSVTQSEYHSSAFKPAGLWISVEGNDDWPSWCETEEFDLENLECATRVILSRKATVCYIKNSIELIAFHEKYVAQDSPSYGVSCRINWHTVARDFQGVIIAPYQYSCRHDQRLLWYYGWDCASGCIWDSAAVTKLQRLATSKSIT